MAAQYIELDDFQKKAALENALRSINGELYSLCLSAGIDPDSIDTSDTDDVEERFGNPSMARPEAYTLMRIHTLCTSHNLIKQKLSSMA
jgi:hypothetical protein